MSELTKVAKNNQMDYIMDKTKVKMDLMLQKKYKNTSNLPETTTFMHLP